MDTLASQQLLQAAAGGSLPSVGDVIQFTEKGWRFRPIVLDTVSIAWGAVSGKPDTATRWPKWDEVTDKPSGGIGAHRHDWDDLDDVPTEFPPSAHASSHESGGGDEVFLQNLTGTLLKVQQHGQTAYLDAAAAFAAALSAAGAFTTSAERYEKSIESISTGANIDNHAPSTYSVIRITPTANINFTGISVSSAPATYSGRKIKIFNVDATFNVTVVHESGASFGDNRIRCPGSVNYVLGPNAGVELWYDSTTARWRLLAA